MITYIIIGITCLISITAFGNLELKAKFLFNPYLAHHSRQWYRFLSHAFIHADWMHLIFNMMTLYFFGPYVEEAYVVVFGLKGYLFFVLLYILGIVLSSSYSYEKHKNNIHYNSLGASGAVAAVLFAHIILSPLSGINLMILPIPGGIPAWLFGILYLAMEWYLDKRGQDNVAHDAHFFGAIFGLLFTIALRPAFVQEFIFQLTGQ